MPKSKYTKKKKTYKKKYRQTKLSLPIGGFGKTKMVKLRYCEENKIDAPSTGVGVQVYRATSLFDPNFTGTGLQPSNFDRWMANYDHYTVISAKITITPIFATFANPTPPGYLGVLVSDSGTRAASLTPMNLLEQKLVSSHKFASQVTAGFPKVAQVSRAVSITKFFNIGKKAILASSEHRGSATSSPTDNAFFEVFVASMVGNNPTNLNFLTEIEYVAILTEPKPTDAS